MDGVSPFLVVSLPLMVVTLLVQRPFADHQRPRIAAQMGWYAATGVVGSVIGGDAGFVIAFCGVLPQVLLIAAMRRAMGAAQRGDGAGALRAVVWAERLSWPTTATPNLLGLRQQAHDLLAQRDAMAEHLRGLATSRRATPAVAVRIAQLDGDLERVEALARAMLAADLPAEEHAAALAALARIDVGDAVDWWASHRSGRTRRGSPIGPQLAILAGAGRVDAVAALCARLAFTDDRTAELTAQARLPAALTAEQLEVVDRIETEATNTAGFFGADLGGWRPYLTWATVVVLAAVYVVELTGDGITEDHLVRMGAFVTGLGPIEWYRAFTAAYLHANLTHILFNTVALAALGRFVEARIGRIGFLVNWLVSATGAFVVLGWLHHDRVEITIGASGGVMGMLGAAVAILFLQRGTGRSALGDRQLRLFAMIAVLQLLLDTMIPNVSQVGHIAGFCVGVVVGLVWMTATGKRIAVS